MSKKVEEGSPTHYMRVRPKDGVNVAFYAPSADITHIMKGALSSVLSTTFTKEPVEGDTPEKRFALNLADFMRCSVLAETSWECSALPKLRKIFDELPPKEATEFLYRFFYTMMDHYWHSMRLTTDSPGIKIDEMVKALGISSLLRTMPEDMRVKYEEHLCTYNMLPQSFYEGALFTQVEEEVNDAEG